MKVYGKSVALIEDQDDAKYGPNGGFTAVLSTPSLDRDGDRLARQEWQEPLPESVPLDADHGMSVATTIGSFRPYFEGDQLMMEARFSSIDRAQEVRTLVKEKHINRVSVAFLTDKTKKSGEPCRELLNAGIVAIPSNRDAVILDSKALDEKAVELLTEGTMTADEAREVVGLDKAKTTGVTINVTPRVDMEAFAKEFSDGFKAAMGAGAAGGDKALLQAIHDASVHMGAVCIAPIVEAAEKPSPSADGANKSFTLDEIKPEDMSLEQFTTLLSELLIGTESPAETPAEPAAESVIAESEVITEDAVTEEPAAEAAVDAADLEVQAQYIAMQLELLTLLDKE
jgi:predicted metal-binding transcription factor (methanogenesis marker protein 9)